MSALADNDCADLPNQVDLSPQDSGRRLSRMNMIGEVTAANTEPLNLHRGSSERSPTPTGRASSRHPDALADEYARLCATPSDIYLHLPRMVALVKETSAKHVIELGTRTGVSTLAWLYGLAITGGRLTSVDLDDAPPIGEHEHWTFIKGDDLDPAVLDLLEPADIVFIDTSHHFVHTLRELHTYRWLVKPGGFIVCHDTELARPEAMPATDPVYPVKRAIEQFVKETGFDWFNVTECYGFGVIKVV